MKKHILIAAIMMISSWATEAQTLTANFAVSDTTPCQGNFITITPLGTGNIVVWKWSLLGCNPDTRFTYSPMESPFQVQVVADESFPLTLIVMDADGNSSTQVISLNTIPKPITTGTSDAAGVVCESTPVTLTASGATTYTWLLDVDTIALHADSILHVTGGGNYSVIGESYGCYYPPQPIKVSEEVAPVTQAMFTFYLIPDSIKNNTVHLCSSSSYIDLEENVSAQYPVTSHWSNGAAAFNSGPVTVGSYQCTLTSNETGCVYPLDSISIVADLPPLKNPQAVVQGTLIVSRATYPVETYQWFKGSGIKINGATNSVYEPTSSGKYYVRVSSGACFALSNVIRFVSQLKQTTEILSSTDIVAYEIFDITGKKMQITADDLPEGLYIIRAQFSDGSSDAKEVSKLSGNPINIEELFKE